MDISERIVINTQKMTGIQKQLEQLESHKQELLQEILRLDGECRLLKEMEQ